ncbi:MAG: plastocyanin/azurin family copper-binding protein [Acidimicrobiia bacterium]
MFRGTAPRLTLLALVSAIALPCAVAFAPPAQAEPIEHKVTAANTAFTPREREINANDTVTWILGQGETSHAVTLDRNGDGELTDAEWAQTVELDANSPTFSHTFTTAGNYGYVCYHHLSSGMTGVVRVAAEPPPPPPTTTTTTAPPPTTTTTTAPPPTTTTTTAPPAPTTTTRPRSTTTTTQPPAAPPTTQPPAQASTGNPTTDTTARATTTTAKKPSTTTTAKKKGSTTTTKAPETTTTTALALPAEWIPTPDITPDGEPTTTTTEPDFEAALTSPPKAPKGGGGGGGGFPAAGAAGLGLLLLGGLGYAWYHRSSRYLPA